MKGTGLAVKPLTFTLPIRTRSEANLREHRMKTARRTKAQRLTSWVTTFNALKGAMWSIPVSGPLTITLTRIGKKPLDSDNLAISCKHVRDGIADAIGVDDGDESLTWLYAQRKGEYCVEVKIEVKP